jgi:hypothetical protein
MPNSAQTTQPDLFASAVPLMANGQKLVFSVTRLQGHAFTSMMRYQIEALGFLKRRYEQDVKLVDDLTATEDVNKAFDICAGFVEKAMAEYSAQAGKVATMSSELASEVAEQMQKEAKTIREDVASVSQKMAEAATA